MQLPDIEPPPIYIYTKTTNVVTGTMESAPFVDISGSNVCCSDLGSGEAVSEQDQLIEAHVAGNWGGAEVYLKEN